MRITNPYSSVRGDFWTLFCSKIMISHCADHTNARTMLSKNQWISDAEVLKTCVLAHSVCISWLSGHVASARRTHNSLAKSNVLRRCVCLASPATGFCFEAGFFLFALSECIFVQSFACSSEQVSVTRHIAIAWRTLRAKAKWSANLQEQHLWSVSRPNQWFLEVTRSTVACWKLQEEW